MTILSKIEAYLRRTGTPPTRFGRDAVRDPRFVLDLRRGREPGARTCARVAAYLEQTDRSVAP
jgi:2,4-dienoyl-CoA reductase-like NADH-dependent reductase (Old Yellow Enzyme family)